MRKYIEELIQTFFGIVGLSLFVILVILVIVLIAYMITNSHLISSFLKKHMVIEFEYCIRHPDGDVIRRSSVITEGSSYKDCYLTCYNQILQENNDISGLEVVYNIEISTTRL